MSMAGYAEDILENKRYNISEAYDICGDDILKTSPRILGYRNYSANDLEKAVQAKTAGASINELTIKYNVPRKTIYEHHRKSSITQAGLYKNYSVNDLEKAVQARAAGAPVSMLSSMYNVPTATIYQHHKKNILTMNTSDRTAESSVTQPRSYKNYSANDLEKAVQARAAGAPLGILSSMYNIPISTIEYNQKKSSITQSRSYKNYSVLSDDLEKAVQARTAGASLNELSKTYNIPKYTIYHHHKKSILMMNTGDKTAEFKRAEPRLLMNRKYSANDLEKAVQARIAGTPLRELSMKYNIPISTIAYHQKKNIETKNAKDNTARKW